MIGLALCLLAFAGTFIAFRKAHHLGISVLLTVGYSYGILRANFPDRFSHFLFDAAVVGLYLARLSASYPKRARLNAPLRPWIMILISWPVLLFLIPFQSYLVQLVGLRAAIFFLPLILIGAELGSDDWMQISRAVIVLNLVAFGFALGEYFLGLTSFFPLNPVTELIYRSRDIGGVGEQGAFRIPSTFPNAHAYAGTMVATFALLLPLWLQRKHLGTGWRRALNSSLLASGIAVFMAGARTPVVLLVLLLLAFLFSLRIPLQRKISLAPLLILGLLIILQTERLQRFTTLAEIEMVMERIYVSANMKFLEILGEYPLGAGLARAAGTSLPFFLEGVALPQIGLENEYSRILLEQGIIGLGLWLAFLSWLLVVQARRGTPQRHAEAVRHRLILAYALLSWATAVLGTGTLTSIPQTAILLLFMGSIGRPGSSRGAFVRRHHDSHSNTTVPIPPNHKISSSATYVSPLGRTNRESSLIKRPKE